MNRKHRVKEYLKIVDKLKAYRPDIALSSDFIVGFPGETDKDFVFNFRVENIKIIPGAYDVVISSKLLSEFTNKQYNLKYFIALEPDSTYEG